MLLRAFLTSTFLLGTFFASSNSSGQLPSPELLSLGKLGGQIGQLVSPLEKANGQNLSGSIPLFSSPAIVDGKIADTHETGVIQVRAKNQLGLSNSRNFLISKEPWSFVEANESSASAVPIVCDGIFQDECPERGRNYYRLRFDHDQFIQISSFAHALDSRAQLILAIQSSSSTTIATANATNDRDAFLQCSLADNTDYTLVVHDQLFRGGPDYRYALQIMAIDKDSESTEPATAIWHRLSKQLATIQKSVATQSPMNPSLSHPRCSMVRTPILDKVPLVHDESATPNATPMLVTYPCLIDGAFDANDDVDIFDFECDKDSYVAIETVSQRIGELTDSVLVLSRVENPGQPNEKINRIVENDDLPGIGNGEMRFAIKDSLLTFKAAEKGTYRLSIRNQQRLQAGPSPRRYAIEIRPSTPGFVLASHWACPVREPDQARMTSNTISVGGSAMLSIHALRFDGFNTAIELTASGLPKDILGGAGVMASDQNIATLNLWHDSQYEPQSTSEAVSSLLVTGHATNGEQKLMTVATTVEVTWNLIDTFRSPIARIASDLLVVRSLSSTCPLTIELGPKAEALNGPISLSGIRGQPLKVPIRVTRRPGGESAVIVVRLKQSPTKTTAAEVKIEAKTSEGTLELQIPKDAPVGDYMLSTLCEAPISIPNADPAVKDKPTNLTLQLPSSSIRLRIGDAP